MIFTFVSRIVRTVFPSTRASSLGTAPRSPADVEAALAAIAEALNRDSGRPHPATPYTPSEREPNEDGLIVTDGPGTLEWFPYGPPLPPGPPPERD